MLSTNERFLPTGGTFRVILANENHWLRPVMVLSIHWWPAPAGVGRVYVCLTNNFSSRMSRDYHGFGIHSPLINYVVHRLPICVSLIHLDLQVSCIPNMSLSSKVESISNNFCLFSIHIENMPINLNLCPCGNRL